MADFQEVADKFRELVEDIQQDPAQLLQNGTEERFKEIAMHAVTRTDAQKDFAKSQEENFFISKRQELVDRQLTLNAKLKTDLSEVAEANAEAELAVLERLLQQNDRILDSIDAQTHEYGLAIGKVLELNEFERRRAEIASEMEEIKVKMVGLSGEELRFQQELLEALEGEDKLRKNQAARSDEIDAAQVLRNKQEEVFGFSVQGANDKIKEMGALMDTTAGRIALIAAAMKIVMGPVVKHMKELRDLGLSWSQTMEAGADSIRAAMDVGMVRGLLTMRNTLEVTTAMRRDFADISFQTHEMIAVGSEMGTAFKLTGDEAANLVEILTKVGGLTAESQEEILHMAFAFGKVNDLRPDALIRAMAEHAGVFARFGEDGAQAFLESVGAAKRLGLELSSIESAADSFLDVDTFFQDVSKLRTLGLDISDPFGLAQIAETGTPAELIAELQQQLQGVDLTQLSRTRRNALSSALGMDQAELSRLIQGDVGGIEGVSEAQIDELGGFNEGMGGAVDALDVMVGSLGGIGSILGKLVDLLVLRAALGGAGSLLGGLGGVAGAATGVAGTVAGGLSTAAGIGGSVLAAGGTAAAGIGASPVLLAGLAAAGIVAGAGIANESRKVRRDEASEASFEASRAEQRSRNEAIHAAQAHAQQNPGITAEDLVKAMMGIGFNIDGRQAGRLISQAQGSANR